MSDERLLAGRRPTGPLGRGAHLSAYGPLGPIAGDPPGLLALAETSGLRGRGGAGFPMGRKLRAVAAARGRKVVVANGAEGEPASRKDRVLLESLPHLVLDGVALAATAVGAREARVCVSAAMARALAAVGGAIAERRDEIRLRLEVVADGYVAGEESALVHALNGGPPRPTTVPPRPFERGVDGRPTLVQNVETLAHLALVARHGAAWFRALGTPADPGTTLVTVSGAVARPGVYELALGTPVGRLAARATPSGPPRAFLVGGYFGAWVSATEADALPLAHDGLRALGGSLGCGVVIALPHGACGVCQTARVLDYLARESAGQCGPCVFGLRAIAGAMAEVARGEGSRATLERLARWAGDVAGRGACHHPDGAVRLLRSALDVFAEEVEAHGQRGRCPSGERVARLRVPVRVAAA